MQPSIAHRISYIGPRQQRGEPCEKVHLDIFLAAAAAPSPAPARHRFEPILACRVPGLVQAALGALVRSWGRFGAIWTAGAGDPPPGRDLHRLTDVSLRERVST